MSEDPDTTALYSEEKLNEEDFYDMLKGFGVSKADSDTIKNEYRH